MKNILVTGGAGYIGSHIVKLLLDEGHGVVVFDNLSEGHREAVLGGDLIVGDLADREGVDSLFAAHHFDAVIHFAANCYVGESVTDPEKYYRNNVNNSLNLFSVMRRYQVRSLIFSSSAAVYGEPFVVPIQETHPRSPINPYGFTKYVVENMLSDFSRAYGFRFAALRYFNAAGAHPSGLLGESHDPETHLIPRVLAAALGRIPQVEIFGDDYPTEDGTCVRDYIHVSDLAQAHWAALRVLWAGGENIVVNLGNSRGYSVKEIIREAERVARRTIPVVHSPRRAGDPPVLVCDNAAAREKLGWTPQISSLQEILETAWRWEQHRRY